MGRPANKRIPVRDFQRLHSVQPGDVLASAEWSVERAVQRADELEVVLVYPRPRPKCGYDTASVKSLPADTRVVRRCADRGAA